MSEAEARPDRRTVSELRIEVVRLQTNFKRAVAAGTAAIAALGAVGYGKLNDIEHKAREKIDESVAKGSEYFELIINGQTRIQASQWSAAIPYLEKARTIRPDDELTLLGLFMSYTNNAEIDPGLRLLDEVEKGGLFNKKLSDYWILLNVARLLTIASIEKPELSKKADYYIGRAVRSAELLKGGELPYALYARAIYEYSRSDRLNWKLSLRKAVTLDPRIRDWPTGDRPDPWFQLVLRKYPKFSEDFERETRAGR